MRRTGVDRPGAACRLPAELLAMWVMGGLIFEWVSREHVVDEIEETLEALRC